MNNRIILISLLVISFILSTYTTIAQPQIEWIYNYGSAENEIGTEVAQTSDGGYIVVGAQKIGDNSDDWYILRVNAVGEIEWEKTIGTERFERARDIKQTADDGYIVIGSLEPNGGDDFAIVKLDVDGEIEWQKQYGDNFHELAHAVTLTADGGYVIAGSSNGLGGNNNASDGQFLKLDADGNLEWEKRYGGSLSEEVFDIHETADLGFIAVGCSNSIDGDLTSNNGQNDLWALKMDKDGNLEWSKSYGGFEDEATRSIQQSPDGGYIIAGYTRSSDGDVANYYGGEDAWVLKLDPNGDLEWEKNYGGQAQDRALSVQNLSTGGFVVSGWSRSSDGDVGSNIGLIDIWIFEIDDLGNIQWEQNFGGSGIDQSFDIKQTTDGGFIVTGNTNSSNVNFTNNLGGFDLWMMKLAPMPVGLFENNYSENIDIFPNPSSGQFFIKSSDLEDPVAVRIYDAQGKFIYSDTKADLNQAIFIESVPSGLYFLEVSAEEKSYRQKIWIE